MIRIAILIALVTVSVDGIDWFVRPPVIVGIDGAGNPIPAKGIYGNQQGTSYANAWNGLKSVVFGAKGVKSGDTLWVIGTHLHRSTNINYIATQGRINPTNGFPGNPVLIRGDFPSEPGIVWGACQEEWDATPWKGPDLNGVWWRTNKYQARFQELDTGVQVLKRQTSTTWTGDDGAAAWFPNSSQYGTNFVKPFPGYGLTNLLVEVFGYRFHLGTNSWITFSNLTLNCSLIQATSWGSGQEDAWKNSRYITFGGVDFNWDSYVEMRPGHDDWTFTSCSFYYVPFGIYTLLERKAHGANRLTVTDCLFDTTNPSDFPHIDGHAIGVQGGSGHRISHNTMTNINGSAIEFWTGPQPMRDHVISYNYITKVRDRGNTITSSGGIEISGDGLLATAGLRTGIEIYGNVIQDVGIDARDASWMGTGISSNNKDSMLVYNNTIYNCVNGLRSAPSGTTVKGEWFNNVIVNATNRFLIMTGSGSDESLLVDYNCYWQTDGSSIIHAFAPAVPRDEHSMTNDPGWCVVSGMESFVPPAGSPLVDAGMAGGHSTDFMGTPVPSGPETDIGAAEHVVKRLHGRKRTVAGGN